MKKKSLWLPQSVLRRMIPEERLQSALRLFPGKTRKEVECLLQENLCKTMTAALVTALLLMAAGYFVSREEETAQTIQRPGAGETEIVQQLQVEGEDGWEIFDLVIASVEYTEEQIEQLHRQTETYLDVVVPGENGSFTEVETDLCFPAKLPQGFEVSWSTDNLWILDTQGTVKNADLEAPAEVQITAKVFYGTEFRLYERSVTVWPKVYTQKEKVLLEVKEALETLEAESRTEEWITLPADIRGRNVRISEGNKTLTGAAFGLVAVLLPILVYQRFFGRVEEKRKRQMEEAQKGYTEFVTKLSLLLVAGISMRQAFGRLYKEYERAYGRESVLTKELYVTYQELSNGCPETVVYEAFGDRIGLVSYQRMAAILVQNCTKGVKNMRELLLHEAKEVMAEERAGIRIRGEQAGTKLLLPMMGFLILIFAILLVPAFGMF